MSCIILNEGYFNNFTAGIVASLLDRMLAVMEILKTELPKDLAFRHLVAVTSFGYLCLNN